MITRLLAARDRGAALLVTMLLGVVMVLLVGAALGAVSSGSFAARTDQDSTGALDAAYSGVQDYLVRINGDPSYRRFGNANSVFTRQSGSTVTAQTANPAFDVTAGGTWATVPGSNGAASFRYEVDNHAYLTSGIIRLRATGRVGGVTKSLIAGIHQRGFTSFIYFTNLEINDPAVSGDPPSCVMYAWQGRASSCQSVQFTSSDVINGPLHSNDTILSCGTTFNGPVTTGQPGGGSTTVSGCSSGPQTFSRPGDPKGIGTIGLPSSNQAMQAQTDEANTSTPGCLYTGPTTITLTSDGKMNVVSPWTIHTVVNGTGFDDSAAVQTRCGSRAQLNSVAGATVPVPSGNVVYVQDVPTSSANVNYPVNGIPAGLACYGAGGTVPSAKLSGSSGSAGWWYGTDVVKLRHPLAGDPMTGEWPANGWQTKPTANSKDTVWSTTAPAYGCTSGDAYVQGTLAGQLSIAASNYVWITGDLTYRSTATDLLGLVGTNGVFFYNPMKVSSTDSSGNPTAWTPLLSGSNRIVQACLLSPAHTVKGENIGIGGSRGTLTVYGSIAQNFRGAVATGGGANGYNKNYTFDPRLSDISPPYFLTPTIASFHASSYASTGPGFAATGAPN